MMITSYYSSIVEFDCMAAYARHWRQPLCSPFNLMNKLLVHLMGTTGIALNSNGLHEPNDDYIKRFFLRIG